MTLVGQIQTFLADRGFGQYPEPEWRVMRRPRHPWPMHVRIAVGLFSMFWIIILSGVLLAMCVVAWAFIRAMIS